MRSKPAPIYRICGRHCDAAVFETFYDFFVVENTLDRRLCVVEIAFYTANVNVGAFLRDHLHTLHLAHSVRRIKHEHVRAFDVLKSFERGFAGVAACCRQNESLLVKSELFLACGEQIWQNRERDVLERTSRAVPQFEHIKSVLDFYQRANGIVVKTIVRSFRVAQKFLEGKLVHIQRQDFRRTFGIIEGNEIFYVRKT